MSESGSHHKVNQQVWRMYPEFKGVQPEERATSGGSSQSTAVVLTYKTRVSLPGGKNLPLWVKVNLSAAGEILKISSSK